MNEPNRHFEINWVWEDSVADAAQALAAGADGPGRQGTGGGAASYQLNVSVLSQADYTNIPFTAGLSSGISPNEASGANRHGVPALAASNGVSPNPS